LTGNRGLPFTIPIVATVGIYIWFLDPIAPPWLRPLPTVVVLALAIARAVKTGEWGINPRALIPALRAAAVLTLCAVGLFTLAGMMLETLHARENPLGDLGFLLLWGGGQQFVLQTVVFRESETIAGPRLAFLLAASLFAALHLPNPFLTAVTFVGGLAWCRIFRRHPNIIPLALSHALATLAILVCFDEAVTGRLRVGVSYLALD
jgi:membrane protease YdiL (CAAX protease family)